MTTDQTIDGVFISRQLAERLTKAWYETEARNELRALLDAPAVERKPFGWFRTPKDCPLQGMFLHYDPVHGERDIQNALDFGFTVNRLYSSPAAKPQGEPDYYRIETPKTWVNGIPIEYFPAMLFYTKAELPKNGEYRILERLYAEQPAPVAVNKLEMAHVVRAHMEIPGCPVLTSNQCYTLAMKLNACIDEVTRLNTKE